MLNASKFILNCKPLTIEELASNPETVIDGMIVEGTGGMFRTKSGKYAAVMPASWLTLFGE